MAMVLEELVHVPPVVTSVSAVVLLMQADGTPVMAEGEGLTVITFVLLQPARPTV